jgi:hypothetical protein
MSKDIKFLSHLLIRCPSCLGGDEDCEKSLAVVVQSALPSEGHFERDEEYFGVK